MKKLVYILMITFVSALTITSCTEEEVNPTGTENGNMGGAGIEKV